MAPATGPQARSRCDRLRQVRHEYGDKHRNADLTSLLQSEAEHCRLRDTVQQDAQHDGERGGLVWFAIDALAVRIVPSGNGEITESEDDSSCEKAGSSTAHPAGDLDRLRHEFERESADQDARSEGHDRAKGAFRRWPEPHHQSADEQRRCGHQPPQERLQHNVTSLVPIIHPGESHGRLRSREPAGRAGHGERVLAFGRTTSTGDQRGISAEIIDTNPPAPIRKLQYCIGTKNRECRLYSTLRTRLPSLLSTYAPT